MQNAKFKMQNSKLKKLMANGQWLMAPKEKANGQWLMANSPKNIESLSCSEGSLYLIVPRYRLSVLES